jgi:hypothetical protein
VVQDVKVPVETTPKIFGQNSVNITAPIKTQEVKIVTPQTFSNPAMNFAKSSLTQKMDSS